MVFIAHRATYPRAYAEDPEVRYRIEVHHCPACPIAIGVEAPGNVCLCPSSLDGGTGDGWDVYLDPPADPIGWPLVEAIDDELAN